MELLAELKEQIKQEADNLICETHPEVCRLRDEAYTRLEHLVLEKIFEEEEPVSAQTALAEIEIELSHS
jgi:hypothetical protein